jgi:hypothetical protein
MVFHHQRLHSSRWAGNATLYEPDELDVPHLGPHWHLVGDGWLNEGCRACLEISRHRALRSCDDCAGPPANDVLRHGRAALIPHARSCGWIVSNKGVRVSVYATAFYLLTHAGFARRRPSQAPDGTPRVEIAARVGASYPRARSPVETVTWFGMGEFRRSVPRKVPLGAHVCARCGEVLGSHDVIPVAYLPAGPPPKGDINGDPAEWRAEGLNVPRSRAELAARLERRLQSGAWKIREPRGLERWEILTANAEADEAWSRTETDRIESSVWADQGGRGRPSRRGQWSDHLNGEEVQ